MFLDEDVLAEKRRVQVGCEDVIIASRLEEILYKPSGICSGGRFVKAVQDLWFGVPRAVLWFSWHSTDLVRRPQP